MQSIAASITNRQIERRVFLTLDRVINSYCELSTQFNPTGDFEIEVAFVASDATTYRTLLGGDVRGDNEIGLHIDNSGVLKVFAYSGTTYHGSIGTAVVDDDKLHVAKVTYTGSTIELFVDGVSNVSTTLNLAGTEKVGVIGRRSDSSNYFDGIIADVNLSNKVTTTNSQKYALDRAAGTTEHSKISSHYVTYNNLPESNREIYKREPTNSLWVGSKELLTNPDFDLDTVWTKDTGWTISGGSAHFYNETEVSRLIYQAMTRPSSYRLQAEISAITNNNLQFYDGASYSTTLNTVGNHRFDVDNADLAYLYFGIRANNPSIGGAIELDRVSMKRILRIA